VIPCDGACLLRLAGDDFVPVAGRGLAEKVDGAALQSERTPAFRRPSFVQARPFFLPIAGSRNVPWIVALRSKSAIKVHVCLGVD